MKSKKYLPLYFEFMKQNSIPIVSSPDDDGEGGLCNIFPGDKFLKLLTPYSYELETAPYWGFWGCDGMETRSATEFTPLRQNIVLFMAAMNGEL